MRSTNPDTILLIIASLFTCVAAGAGMCLAIRVGPSVLDVSLFGLGVSLGPCLAAYALVPTRRKQTMRRLVLFTGGLSILAFSLLASASIDLEGFFLLLFEGVAGAAIGHTIATLLVGPLLFGRFLCGWGCWRAMILELLPLKHGTSRREGVWRYLPFAGLAACIAAAAISFFVFGRHAGGAPRSPHIAGAISLISGVAVYWAVSIALAFTLKDQRAFCKYLCPNLPVLRLTSRVSLLKMAADKDLCDDCGACSRVCPMDIDVRAFAATGKRVVTGECILCQRCAHVCPRGALSATVKFDRAA
jgi:polyferredoxin